MNRDTKKYKALIACELFSHDFAQKDINVFSHFDDDLNNEGIFADVGYKILEAIDIEMGVHNFTMVYVEAERVSSDEKDSTNDRKSETFNYTAIELETFDDYSTLYRSFDSKVERDCL